MPDPSLNITVGQCTDAGRKAINQDFHGLVQPAEPQLSSKGIAVAIADGISSSQVSQVASETAVKGFFHDYYCTADAWSVKKSVFKVLSATNAWLYAQTKNSPYRLEKEKGYICTFSAVVFKSNTAFLFHSGDCRIYRVVGNNLEQLTRDHRHEISQDSNYLTRALGIHEQLKVDYASLPIESGDTFILATDGVYEYLSGNDIAHAVSAADIDFDVVARQLVDRAISAGSPDNLTLQVVRIDSVPDKQRDEVHRLLESLHLPPVLAPRMVFDGYEIMRELYISSRSHVLLAKQADSGQVVVIKTPSTEMRHNSEYLEAMLMEDWIARRINSNHVLRSLTPTTNQRYVYAASEYIEGKSLAQWMIDNPEPSMTQVRDIIGQIAKGLRAFHRQEMVHQDIRPQNILIDNTGTVKIIDFGSTKVAGLSETCKRNHGIVGTLQYTAPEYFLGAEGTSRSDIFSLGVIAYQMLCGKLPYGNDVSKAGTRQAQNRLAYSPLPFSNKSQSQWVDCAIRKAVQVQPQKRYQEAAEFIHDLHNPSLDYLRQMKPPLIERNPVMFWQAVSVVLLMLLLMQNAL